MIVAIDTKPAGVIAVADTVKEHAAEAIAELKKLGIRVKMLTGDNMRTARAIAEQVSWTTTMSSPTCCRTRRPRWLSSCRRKGCP